MKHRVRTSRFGRHSDQAKWLYRSLAVEIMKHGRIETTKAKAKAIRGLVDSLIGWGKIASVASRRLIVKALGSDAHLDLICKEVAPKLNDRNSGYTRIVKVGRRFSDKSEMVIMELVNYKFTPTVSAEVVMAPKVESEKVEVVEEVQAEEKPVKKAPSKAKKTVKK